MVGMAWPVLAVILLTSGKSFEPDTKSLRQSFTYVVERAAKTPAKKTVLETLLSFPKVSHSPVAYLDAADRKVSPVTAKTLIQTQDISIEDGLEGMGRIARAEIGPFPAFFYKSTVAYHRKWFSAYRSGKERTHLSREFKRPGPKDPCIGFSIALDEAMSVISGREAAAYLKKAWGKPVKESGRPGMTSDEIGDYWAEWRMKDRILSAVQGESSALLIRVIFLP